MIFLTGTPLEVTMFPDNTSQVWKLSQVDDPSIKSVQISWDYQHEGEFMQLAQLKMLLDANNMLSLLYLKYLPYGRQDKAVSNDKTFALHTFARLLNSLKFGRIVICDPHSNIALELIDNSHATYPREQVKKVAKDLSVDLFCYPDSGALAKYAGRNIYVYPYVYGEKVRDQLTGNIISYKLVGDVVDQKVLIVDDICDGGATFKLLAAELFKAGAIEVNLFVTHGIFSKGIRTLKDSGINRIFTQDGEQFGRNVSQI